MEVLVKILAIVLKFWCYLFALFFGLFLTGIALVLLLTGATNFQFNQLPFLTGWMQLAFLLIAGLLGILAALLGYARGARLLLSSWTGVVFVLLAYGYFVNTKFYFTLGASQAWHALWLSLGALLAFFGSLAEYQKGRA
jgi:hypothetical protein